MLLFFFSQWRRSLLNRTETERECILLDRGRAADVAGLFLALGNISSPAGVESAALSVRSERSLSDRWTIDVIVRVHLPPCTRAE